MERGTVTGDKQHMLVKERMCVENHVIYEK